METTITISVSTDKDFEAVMQLYTAQLAILIQKPSDFAQRVISALEPILLIKVSPAELAAVRHQMEKMHQQMSANGMIDQATQIATERVEELKLMFK